MLPLERSMKYVGLLIGIWYKQFFRPMHPKTMLCSGYVFSTRQDIVHLVQTLPHQSINLNDFLTSQMVKNKWKYFAIPNSEVWKVNMVTKLLQLKKDSLSICVHTRGNQVPSWLFLWILDICSDWTKSSYWSAKSILKGNTWEWIKSIIVQLGLSLSWTLE